MERLPIKDFSGLDTVSDNTDAARNSLGRADNLMLRPLGGLKRLPTYDRLFSMLNLATYNAALGLTNVDGTCLLRIVKEGQVFLCFWDVPNSKSLGFCFAADDGSNTGNITLTAATPTITVLKRNLAAGARWYFSRFYDEVWMGNGVNPNLIYQHARTGLQLRPTGVNATPLKPLVSTIVVNNNVGRASLTIPIGTAELFLGADTSNYPGNEGLKLSFEIMQAGPSFGTTLVRSSSGGGYTHFELRIGPDADTSADAIYAYLNSSGLKNGYFTLGMNGTDGTANPGINYPNTFFAGTDTTATLAIPTAGSIITVRADSTNYSGAAGNNIKIEIVDTGTDQPIIMTRAGAGTTTSPFIFTITLGLLDEDCSPDAILALLASDPLAADIISATIDIPDGAGDPGFSFPLTSLAGGSNGAASRGFLDVVTRVGLTFFDPGVGGLGYETAMSQYSTAVTINEPPPGTNGIPLGKDYVLKKEPGDDFSIQVNRYKVRLNGGLYPIYQDGSFGGPVNGFLGFPTAKDLQVGVRANTAGEMARFTKIRIYLEFWESGRSVFKLVRTVDNVTANHRIGTDTLVSKNYDQDQNTLAPCTMFEMVKDRIWAAGNPADPSRIWVGKLAREDEKAPEGFDATKYIDVFGRNEDPERARITSMRASENRAHVHTKRSITLIDGVTLAKRIARAEIGTINPSTSALWEQSTIPYFGSDGVFYEFANQQLYKSNITSKKSLGIIREYADMTALGRTPGRANTAADFVNRLIWIWVPALDGKLVAFAMDFATGGIVGPMDFPKLLSTTRISSADGRLIGCDEDGNLFVVNLDGQNNQQYLASSPFTYVDPLDPVPDDNLGYGSVVLPAGRVLKASQIVFETQFLDFGSPGMRKGFYELQWSTVRNSRGILSITIEADQGHSVTREYGDVYGRERHKVSFMLSGNAIRIRITATVGEDKPFAMRDLTIGFEMQGVS